MARLRCFAFMRGLVLAAALAGCTKQEPGVRVGEAGATADAWLGRWIGPEGTYLDIRGGNGRYALTIADLDGPKAYEGEASGETIAFRRDGKAETIRATDGDGTGMKWLAGKSTCLVVQLGEGFCRE